MTAQNNRRPEWLAWLEAHMPEDLQREFDKHHTMLLYQRDEAFDVLDDLVDSINATGGVVRDEHGDYAPAADEDWTDLGAVYVDACDILDVGMRVPE